MISNFDSNPKPVGDFLPRKKRGRVVNIIEHLLSFIFDPLWWLKYLYLRCKVRELSVSISKCLLRGAEQDRKSLDLARKLDDLRVFYAARRDVGKNTSDGCDHGGLISLENAPEHAPLTGREGTEDVAVDLDQIVRSVVDVVQRWDGGIPRVLPSTQYGMGLILTEHNKIVFRDDTLTHKQRNQIAERVNEITLPND